MRRRQLLIALAAAPIGAACSRALGDDNDNASRTWPGPSRPVSRVGERPPPVGEKLELSESEWRQRLTREQFRVLRQEGTERAFSGAYHDEHRAGTYYCAGCGAPLYSSRHKFDSGTGWPSFYQAVEDGRVERRSDRSHGMVRTELVCARCEGHLGHVFRDGPPPTGDRHCINSVSLTFEPS